MIKGKSLCNNLGGLAAVCLVWGWELIPGPPNFITQPPLAYYMAEVISYMAPLPISTPMMLATPRHLGTPLNYNFN